MSTATSRQLDDLVQRANSRDIDQHFKLLSSEHLIKKILDAIPEAVMILNRFRQVVFVNQVCLETLGITESEAIRGLRPGEVLNCSHSDDGINGCGTSDFCFFCGAHNAILASKEHKASTQELRITSKKTGTASNFRVKATLFEVKDEQFTIFSMTDISDLKHKEVLQSLFFHDIMNTVGSLSGYTELLLESGNDDLEMYKQLVHQMSMKIIDQINYHSQLIAAEKGTLDVSMEEINSTKILEEVFLICKQMNSAKDKSILIDSELTDITFKSDRILMLRVLSNLIKNALEASEDNQSVKVGCKKKESTVEFYVNNQGLMPVAIQHQIFQRSFSTKGKGRGLGTYSIKLFTEHYLNGQVRFESTPESGTTFWISFPTDPEQTNIVSSRNR